MLTNSPSRWWPRMGAFALWALAAASAAFWGLKFSSAPAGPASVQVAQPLPAAADPAAVARLLGAGPAAAPAAAPSLASRFALVGVAAGRSHGGAALIAVDGKPAKPFRVGAQVEPGLVLQSVAPRRATLGADLKSPPAFVLEIPLPKS
ncbi:MAG: general secretion pathway protein C [Ramlibacter sp.]|nr:general secretion pathway protein C [Ramlibacter sp.]